MSRQVLSWSADAVVRAVRYGRGRGETGDAVEWQQQCHGAMCHDRVRAHVPAVLGSPGLPLESAPVAALSAPVGKPRLHFNIFRFVQLTSCPILLRFPQEYLE